jgi:flagellar biogenesis protein FliO
VRLIPGRVAAQFKGNELMNRIRLFMRALVVPIEALWKGICRLNSRAPRRLRLCENLPLGERRFVAVVECDSERFLVGGTASSLVLLCRLAAEPGVSREEKKMSRHTWRLCRSAVGQGRLEKC